MPKAVQMRIAPHIEALATEPRPHGCVKLTGSDEYRIRVGDYRVIYAVEDRRLIVLDVRVAHRRDVYHP
ncbi:MAG: type II toxin-antitoxin system RelE/ParE family toxin [Thermoleophilia bacterium]|nr:type II toxin-antitoxin system RelE/ParE family toxin [Thermoleophilia bacterium]